MRSAEELLADAEAAASAGDHDAALACFTELAAREEADGGLVPQALAGRVRTLRALENHAAAIDTLDEVVSRFGQSTDTATRPWAAWALLSKATILRNAGSLEDAIRIGEEAIARFGEDSDDGIRNYVSDALARRAVDLRGLGRHSEALRARENELERYAGSDPAGRPGARLNAIAGRARALSALGRHREALADWNERIAGLEGQTDPTSREAMAAALFGRAGDLRLVDEHEAALTDLDRLEFEFARDEDPSIADYLAGGLLEQVWNWQALGHAKMARPALERLTTDFFSDSGTYIADVVTCGLAARARDRLDDGDFDRAEVFAGVAIERGRETTSEELWEGVVSAAETMALVAQRRGDIDSCLALLDVWITETVARFPGRPVFFAGLLELKILVLSFAKRGAELIALSYEIAERFGESGDPAVRRLVALSLLERVPALGAEGRLEEATGALETLSEYEDEALTLLDWQIGKIDLGTTPWLAPHVAQRMMMRASLLVQCDRDEEGTAAFETLIEQFKDSEDPEVRRIVTGALMTRAMLEDADADDGDEEGAGEDEDDE